MDDNKVSKRPETVSYYEYEEALAREERHTNRWRIFALIIFAVLVLSNVGWIIYENSFQDVVVTENTQDGGGTNIISGGDLDYGSEAKNN